MEEVALGRGLTDECIFDMVCERWGGKRASVSVLGDCLELGRQPRPLA